MKNKLILFRGSLTAKSNYAVGQPIYFPDDGSKGTIYSILAVELQADKTVFVIGKYRPEDKF